MPGGVTLANGRVRDANPMFSGGLETLARHTGPSPVVEHDGREVGHLAWGLMAISRWGAAACDRGGDRLRRRDSGVDRLR